MVNKFLILFLFLFFNLAFIVQGQKKVYKRPKIGLVLSGGGAKGLAHIGALKVLEEAGLPIDYISGTSMGSIVGGLYACGYSAKEIEKIVRNIDWDEVLSDEISRKNVSIEEKEEFERYMGEFPMIKTKVIIPTSMVYGQKVSAILAHYTWPVHTISNFDSLPIPFRCIATDIETVTPVILNKGYLPDAIRASMAIPSYFSPIELDGHLLVDGGIVRNFPVQDAREMGADIIIGIDVSASLYTKRELNSVIKIMDQVSSAQAARSNEEQASKCDILIKPDITNYNMFSFEYMDSLILNGEKAAYLILPRLKSLADSLNKLQKHNDKRIRPAKLDSLHIKTINYEGLDKVSLNLVKGYFEIRDTGWIRLQEIEHGISRLYGTRYFERVNYKITPGENGSILTLRFKEQIYNYLGFSMHYDPYLKTGILISGTFRNTLAEGSRLLFDIKISEYPGATAQYNINTSAHPNLGYNLKASLNSFQSRNYNIAGLLQGTYNINHYLGETDLYSGLSRSFLVRTGFQWEFFDIQKEIEVDDTINMNLQTYSLYSRFCFDTQDRTLFPIKGDYFYGEIKYILNSREFNNLGWTPTFWRIIAKYRKYVPLTRRIVFSTHINCGFSFADKVSIPYNNILGGYVIGENFIFPFDGMKYMAVVSKYVYTAGLSIRLEPWRDKFLSLKTNYGGASSIFSDLGKFDNNYYSLGISAGIRTILGPVEFTLSKCNNNRNLYGELKLGYSF